jgi:glycosyltransferase involved in cell wall biosynthesis
MKRLVVDARESGSSTGKYVDRLVEHLHNLKPHYEMVVLTKPHRIDFMKQAAPDFKIVSSQYKEFTLSEQTGFLKQLKSLNADLVHFGMTQQPVRYKGRAITTIHDLTTARYKNPAKNALVFGIKQAAYRRVIKRAAKKSVKVIVPSQFVKADLAQYAKIEPGKIEVIYMAGDKISAQAEPVAELKDQQFLFYVGRPNPHKNLQKLIEAFTILISKYPDLKLALAGKPDKNYDSLKHYALTRNLTSQVLFLGKVSEGQLRWLYENSLAYVFPSLSEGFGLPGLEAMAHGTPVIASNASCLPEIYGPAAHYFNPHSSKDMALKISQVIESPQLRQSLETAGHIQAAKYSWDKCAKQTLAVYKSILG